MYYTNPLLLLLTLKHDVSRAVISTFMINVNMLCSSLIRHQQRRVGMTQVKYITEYLISNVYRNIVLVIGTRGWGIVNSVVRVFCFDSSDSLPSPTWGWKNGNRK